MALGYRARGAYRERFQVAPVNPADDVGAGIPDLEPTTDTGTQHLNLVIESQSSKHPVTGAGTGAQGQAADVHVIIRRSRPDG